MTISPLSTRTLQMVFAPDPRLRQVSRPVGPAEFGVGLVACMQEMVETMFAAPGVGLAGVQVGDMRRILVCLLDGEVVQMVNPVITRRSRLTHVGEEGCLSFPARTVNRPRSRQVTVDFHTPEGVPVSRSVSGFSARIVQHEIDHLDGKTIAG